MFKAPFTLLLSRQTKMPAATENSRFIIKPAVHEFNNSLFHYSNFNFKYVVIKIVLFIFDAYFKKKKNGKKTKCYTCTHFDQEREKQNSISTMKTDFCY
jgi:hypothetical protein